MIWLISQISFESCICYVKNICTLMEVIMDYVGW